MANEVVLGNNANVAVNYGDNDEDSSYQIVIESEEVTPYYIVEIPSDDDTIEVEVNHDSPHSSGSSLDELTDWVEKHKGTVMNLSTFLGGIAYAAGLNPPGGIWAPHAEDKATYKVGVSILGANNSVEFKIFCFLNLVVLLASFTTVILLLTGIPSSRRMTLLIITVTVAISLIAAVVNVLLITINVFMLPNFGSSPAPDVVSIVLNYIMFVWCGIMTLVVIAYVVKVVKSKRTLEHNKNV